MSTNRNESAIGRDVRTPAAAATHALVPSPGSLTPNPRPRMTASSGPAHHASLAALDRDESAISRQACIPRVKSANVPPAVLPSAKTATVLELLGQRAPYMAMRNSPRVAPERASP